MISKDKKKRVAILKTVFLTRTGARAAALLCRTTENLALRVCALLTGCAKWPSLISCSVPCSLRLTLPNAVLLSASYPPEGVGLHARPDKSSIKELWKGKAWGQKSVAPWSSKHFRAALFFGTRNSP